MEKKTKISRNKIQFPINNSGFDTIVFSRPEFQKIDTIITKFSENCEYILTQNRCCNTFDIFHKRRFYEYLDLYKTKTWQYADSVKRVNESVSVCFQLLNLHDNDMVVGIYGDIFGAFTRGIILKKRGAISFRISF
jgi:hypothetical protein